MAKHKTSQNVASSLPAAAEEVAALEFGAAITDAQREAIEETAHGFGISRRIALAVLSRSKAQLVGPAKENDAFGEASVHMLEAANEYVDHLKAMLDLAQTAQARMQIVCSALVLAHEAA